MVENDTADANIIVNRDANWVEQETTVLAKVESALNGEKLDAVICVAGGWAGGNAKKGTVCLRNLKEAQTSIRFFRSCQKF